MLYACKTDVVFDIVQQRAMDVLYCKKRFESFLAYVKEKRLEGAFQAVYAKAANLKLDLQTEPHNCRIPRSTTKIVILDGISQSRYLGVTQIWKACASWN